MTFNASIFDIDCKEVCEIIEHAIRDYVEKSKTKGVVLGLSGGIDSSVVAALAIRALGKDRVLGLLLPNANLDPSYEKDARKLAEQYEIEIKKISIADFVNILIDKVDEDVANNKLVIGNAMARFRMVLLYAYANHMNYLVIGTSNKTEILVGYLTKYGDGGIDFEPCGELYKTQIRLIAKYLEIPEEIILKPPSAGFWDGQTDEGEIGITYEMLDRILYGFEMGYTKEQIIAELDIEGIVVNEVEKMIIRSEHKRKMPPIFNYK
ncbi:MAG: NAD+ synthase [Candidatus Heimdallarchaeota archaeon]|nr:NAD+ synthase [Candidatus Heimdallarchaeota archaeon]